MAILILFAFIGGIITILSPCILPVLPVVLSSSLTGGKRRPLGIVTGFVASFTFFTLFLSAIVRATGLPADSLRSVAVVILIIFGISLLIRRFQLWMEKIFSTLSTFGFGQSAPALSSTGFFSGIPIGASLGLVWAPCVGPIIASVITLAATSQVNAQAFLITLSYSLGTAIPLLALTYGGRTLLQKVPWLLTNTGTIQKIFGVLMVATAIGIYTNLDRKFQTSILTTFPNYGTGLTILEDNEIVRKTLQQLDNGTIEQRNNASVVGKPMDEVVNKQPASPSLAGRQAAGRQAANNKLRRIAIAPGFENQSGSWINSEPLTLDSLRGKVVLVDFWTYTCINCIRTLPYLRSWYEKYADDGFVIVGVHTPEFEFEKSLENVERAVRDFQLVHPIVQDNDFGIWQDYENRFWPAKYLIDKEGYIRYTHFGEGAYNETEQAIQELLAENGSVSTVPIDNPTYEIQSRTPELYLGFDRLQYLASPEKIMGNTLSSYTFPQQLPLSHFAYEGNWIIANEYATATKDAKLTVHFESQDVFLVMNPRGQTSTTRVRVLLDNKPVAPTDEGEDVNDGVATITSDRLYRLIHLPIPGRHILTLEFLDGDIELFAFTFG